jgi:DNA-directed RNA polymerase sigma subunit (sigma70/sigma32)
VSSVHSSAANATNERRVAAEWDSFLATLNAKEHLVLVRHLGLDGAPPQTYSEIAVMFNMGREPVRKLADKAKVKLSELRQELVGASL